MRSARDREEQAARAARGDDDKIVRPEEPRGSRSVVGQTIGAAINTRSRHRVAEEAVADNASPTQRAYSERAKVIDAYAQWYLDRKQEEAAEEQRKAAAAQKKIDDAKAERELRNRASQVIADNIARGEIRALIDAYGMWGRVEELAAFVKREGFGPLNTTAWEVACQQLKKA